MRVNPILEAKQGGRRAIGAWLTVGSSFTAETMARAGLDCVVVDLQHGSVGWADLGAVIQAIDGAGSCAVVRVPWNDQPSIMRALDFGAAGVIVPMVSTAQEARFAADAVRYPPQGVRSFGPTRGYYVDDPNRIEPACLVMIETKAGLENIAAIAATPGVDGLFVGAADLGLDLGLSLSLKPTPPILAAIDRMIAVCNERGITPGAAGMDTQSSEDFLARGVRFLTLSSDIGYMRRAMHEDVETFKRWRKEK